MARRYLLVILLITPGISQLAAAEDLFRGTFTVDGQSRPASTSTASDFADLLTNQGLSSLFSSYTAVSAANIDASLRGVPAQLSYAAGSTALRLVIPSAGVDETFTGASRDESQDLALEWLRGGGGSALTRVLQQAVATTPFDPVAGNPNSLMSRMGAADFGSALGLGSVQGRVGFGARFGSYSAEGTDSRVYTLPLSTTYDFADGPEILIDAPLTLQTLEGTQSYSGAIGVGARLPVRIGLPDSLAWTLTPMVRIGAVGSVDLGAVGGMWSASLTSGLDWQVRPGTKLTLGNMVSYLQTLPIDYAGYSASYELTNMMFRNGLIVTQDIGEWSGRPVQGTLFAIDTRFTGDALFIRSYQEYGGYLTFANAGGRGLPLSIGLTVLQGERGYRGFTVNLGSAF